MATIDPSDGPDVSGDPLCSSLPDLGRRGEGWVALQVVLIVLIAAAGLRGPRWPAILRPLTRLAALVLAPLGLALFGAAGGSLGRQLTPFPKPVEGGDLRTDGAYGLVRHPIYGGVLLMALAWSLMTSPLALGPWAAAFPFLEAKRRREEAWLAEEHPDYGDYVRQVPRRFIPFVW